MWSVISQNIGRTDGSIHIPDYRVHDDWWTVHYRLGGNAMMTFIMLMFATFVVISVSWIYMEIADLRTKQINAAKRNHPTNFPR